MEKSEFIIEAKRLRPILYSIAYKYLGNGDDADDIAQDAMLKLWTLRPQLHMPIDSLATIITHNLAKDRLRRQQHTINIDDIECDSPPDATQSNDARVAHILAIINSLPPLQQMILRLRHMEGMEYHDIAHITGSSEQAVRKAISRARNQIKNKYLNEENE